MSKNLIYFMHMKRIGLIIATKEEINAFKNEYKGSLELLEESPFNIYSSKLENIELFILNSGIGTIKASVASSILINKYHIELLLNYGVVGALIPNLNISSTFIVNQIAHYDFDLSAIDNLKRGQYQEYSSPLIGVNKNYLMLLNNLFPNLDTVGLASGDKFLNTNKMKKEINKEFNASICDMESAGIIITANMFDIPSLFIKSISDSNNDDSKLEYETNAFSVAHSSIHILFRIIETFDKGYYFVYEENKIILKNIDNIDIGSIKFLKIDNNILDIISTKVDPIFRDKGFAKILIEEYVRFLERNNYKTNLTCSYAINYFSNNEQLKKYINNINNSSCPLF